MIAVIGLSIMALLGPGVALGANINQVTTASRRELIGATRKRIFISTEMSSNDYCAITDCKIITCTSISTLDPGEIASAFIASVFKVYFKIDYIY